MKKVSIVLPCYNHKEFVADAIKSVLDQSYKNFELFIFDNGSGDDSWEEIIKFDDSRINKIKLQVNDLLEVKRQFIERATGDYFAIMHSDDIWKRKKLEKQIDFMNKNKNVHVCFTWSEFVDAQLNPIMEFQGFFCAHNKSEQEWWNTLFNHFEHLSCPSFICEKDIYVRYFGKLYPYRQIADLFCWLKILQETNIYIIEEILVNQRIHNYGENRNESSQTPENNDRLLIETKFVNYRIIDEMEDPLFIKFFCPHEFYNINLTHLDIMCKKFLYLLGRGTKNINEYDNAIRYYNTYFDYVENDYIFYQYLEDQYGFSRNNFFSYEENEGRSTRKLQSRIHRWVLLENTDFSTIECSNSVSIYGCGQVGKILYKKIKAYCHIEQFIDMRPQIDFYEGIPVLTLDKAKVDKDSVIVVIPSYDLKMIIGQIKMKYSCVLDSNIIGFEDFVKKGKVLDTKF